MRSAAAAPRVCRGLAGDTRRHRTGRKSCEGEENYSWLYRHPTENLAEMALPRGGGTEGRSLGQEIRTIFITPRFSSHSAFGRRCDAEPSRGRTRPGGPPARTGRSAHLGHRRATPPGLLPLPELSPPARGSTPGRCRISRPAAGLPEAGGQFAGRPPDAGPPSNLNAAQERLRAFRAEHPEVTAALACNDDLALVTLAALRHIGLRAPEDLATTWRTEHSSHLPRPPCISTRKSWAASPHTGLARGRRHAQTGTGDRARGRPDLNQISAETSRITSVSVSSVAVVYVSTSGPALGRRMSADVVGRPWWARLAASPPRSAPCLSRDPVSCRQR